MRVLLVVAAASALAFSTLPSHPSAAAERGGSPTAGPRQLISAGPAGKLVNETSVAAAEIEGVDYLSAMWQVQDPPGANDTEVPIKLQYAIGTINNSTLAIT